MLINKSLLDVEWLAGNTWYIGTGWTRPITSSITSKIGQACSTFTLLLLTFQCLCVCGCEWERPTSRYRRKRQAGVEQHAHHSLERWRWSKEKTLGCGKCCIIASQKLRKRLYKSTSYYITHILLTVHFSKLPGHLVSTDLLTELNKLHLIFSSQDFSYTGWLFPKFVFKPPIRANTLKRLNKHQIKPQILSKAVSNFRITFRKTPKLTALIFSSDTQYLGLCRPSWLPFKRTISIIAFIICSAKICRPDKTADHFQFSTIQAWDIFCLVCVFPLPERRNQKSGVKFSLESVASPWDKNSQSSPFILRQRHQLGYVTSLRTVGRMLRTVLLCAENWKRVLHLVKCCKGVCNWGWDTS